MKQAIGLTITNDGDFDFFPIINDVDWLCADTVFHVSFDVDGNHTGRTPCADVIAAFNAWRNDNV
jgi:hypothetical protein